MQSRSTDSIVNPLFAGCLSFPILPEVKGIKEFVATGCNLTDDWNLVCVFAVCHPEGPKRSSWNRKRPRNQLPSVMVWIVVWRLGGWFSIYPQEPRIQIPTPPIQTTNHQPPNQRIPEGTCRISSVNGSGLPSPLTTVSGTTSRSPRMRPVGPKG